MKPWPAVSALAQLHAILWTSQIDLHEEEADGNVPSVVVHNYHSRTPPIYFESRHNGDAYLVR
jgi:hypothetical protein